jgi:hypothetical protein
MQEYDVALKLLLKGSATLTVRALTGTVVVRWLDVELPKVQNVQNLRVDLLGQTVDNELVHIELQSGNDPAMPFRMIGILPRRAAAVWTIPTADSAPCGRSANEHAA